MPKIKTEQSSATTKQDISGDNNAKLAFLYKHVMKYMAEAMKRLGMSFAVTGAAVGYEHKLNGVPDVITIALLDEDQLTCPKVVQDEVVALEFDSEDHCLFSMRKGGLMVFSDPRVVESKIKIKFISVAALPPTARIPYSQPYLHKSPHGWYTTSATLLVLNALTKAAANLATLVRKAGGAPLNPKEFSKKTWKDIRRVGRLIRQFPPETTSDEALLETLHKEAIPRLLPFIPDMATFPLFSNYLPGKGSGVRLEPDWWPMSEEKKYRPSSRQRWLRFVAQLAISALQGRGYLSALYGEIARALYRIGPDPKCVDVIVYIPPNNTPQPDLGAIQEIIVERHHSFYLSETENKGSVEKFLFYQPTKAVGRRMGLGLSRFDLRECRVNIIIPPQHGLDPLSATTEINWVESLPVVARELLG